ncbi:hypothetical protein EXIGLDRAFT_770546 [Exidia glandulosa HHB12029]|uniref:CBM1 domain-containing protein n=1 Tax=Exidia glandulosa HHB12029 TaxID=1314781 RepID=A0A165GM27_EXIGL|nr:hypothetical protein EXIGLDRAFT_770546 [Exidia glandulosa HHB12029]
MQPKVLLVLSALVAGLAYAQVQPCFNQADPDHSIGNYCFCEGDGLCYFPGSGSNDCNPTGDEFPCPE